MLFADGQILIDSPHSHDAMIYIMCIYIHSACSIREGDTYALALWFIFITVTFSNVPC